MIRYTITATHPNDRAEALTGTLASLRSRLVGQAERWNWNYAGCSDWTSPEHPLYAPHSA